MRDSRHFDLVIIGAGIAGLSVAFAASKSGMKTAVTDLQHPGSGASGVPQALLNPATGRKAKKTWNAEECLPYTKAMLEEIHRKSGLHFYTNNGVIRPALNSGLAENMYLSYKKPDWPEGWVEWLNQKEMQYRFPGLPSADGGLWVPVACTVALGTFVRVLHDYLVDLDVSFFMGSELIPSGSHTWFISGHSKPVYAENIVYATGKSMTFDPAWGMLPLHRVKGQTLTVELRRRLPFRSSISSLGYLAQGGDASGSVVLGSTYEHHFDDPGPDEKGASYLLERLERTLPDLRKKVRHRKGWSGIRVTTPDKKPFAGKHPELDNLYAIGALGSKGLMTGPYLGKLLAEHIHHGHEIPSVVNIGRLFS